MKAWSGRDIAAWTRVAITFGAGQFHALAQQPQRFTIPAADPGHDLTTREFFKDLGSSYKALLSKRNIAPAVAWSAAYGVSTQYDQTLEEHFAPGNMWGGWAAPGKYIGHPLILGGVSTTLFAVSRRSEDRRFRSFSYALFQGSIMTASIVQPMKAAFGRQRPNEENHHAFPSGHAADTFMYATVAAEHYGWKAAVPAYTVATYVAASRLVDRKHHLTDVVAGAGIGFIIGRTVSGRMKMPSNLSFNLRRTKSGFGASVRIGLP